MSMPAATKLAGTVFKKCDRANHKPDTNKACAAGTCQHTCEVPDKCSHGWTLRYSANGRQRELSFRDDTDPRTGRVKYGSGLRKARDAQLKLAHDKRAQGAVFTDTVKTSRENFGTACETYIARLPIKPNTRDSYTSVYRAWVKDALADMTLGQVATARDTVLDLLTVKMAHLSHVRRNSARLVIVGTLDEAVKAGKLARHALADIELYNAGRPNILGDFVFPSYAQVAQVADAAGIAVWLMRGCGLRVSEALAVHKEDFRDAGQTLRVSGQASRDGKSKVALKKRKVGEYRDVPVPTWLWQMVKDQPDGPLCPGTGERTYEVYGSIKQRFTAAAKNAGIPKGFTPHSLRHVFASTTLADGVQITDVARWLGHRDINETYRTYSHFLPNANDKAVAVLDAEFEKWRAEA